MRARTRGAPGSRRSQCPDGSYGTPHVVLGAREAREVRYLRPKNQFFAPSARDPPGVRESRGPDGYNGTPHVALGAQEP